MTVWFSGSHWYGNTGNIEIEFDTQEEAIKGMAKLQVAIAIIEQVKALAPVMDNAPDRVQEYYDAGTWTDEDVAAMGITAAQLASDVIVLEQFGKLMAGNETNPALYRFTVNAVRRL